MGAWVVNPDDFRGILARGLDRVATRVPGAANPPRLLGLGELHAKVHSSSASSPTRLPCVALLSTLVGRELSPTATGSVEVLQAGLFRARLPEPRCARSRGHSARLDQPEGRWPNMRQELRSREAPLNAPHSTGARRHWPRDRRAPRSSTLSGTLPTFAASSHRPIEARRLVADAVVLRGRLSSALHTQDACLSESANDD